MGEILVKGTIWIIGIPFSGLFVFFILMEGGKFTEWAINEIGNIKKKKIGYLLFYCLLYLYGIILLWVWGEYPFNR
jgi:hypothetical protein